MPKYGVCPKCNLNYIDFEKQEICDICEKQRLGQSFVVDDFSFEEKYTSEELHSPFLQEPAIDSEYEEEKQEDEDGENATWRSYVDDDNDLDMPDLDFSEDEDDIETDEESEEEIDESEEDDFEYVSVDDYCVDDDEEEDEEEDDF